MQTTEEGEPGTAIAVKGPVKKIVVLLEPAEEDKPIVVTSLISDACVKPSKSDSLLLQYNTSHRESVLVITHIRSLLNHSFCSISLQEYKMQKYRHSFMNHK